jgi:hypothetical protein
VLTDNKQVIINTTVWKELRVFNIVALIAMKLGRFGQQIRNTWKVLKCGAGEDQLD